MPNKGTLAGAYAAISVASAAFLAISGGPRLGIGVGEAIGLGLLLFLIACIAAAIMWGFLRWQRALGHVRDGYTQDDEWVVSFATGGIAIAALALLMWSSSR